MKNNIVEDAAAADMEETETTGNFRFMHEKVNHLLKVRGINQAKLREITELGSGTISNICTGRKTPRLQNIELVAEALGVNPLYFFVSGNLAESILPKDMTHEQIEFVLDANNLPYIDAAMYAKSKNVTSKTLKMYVDLVQLTREQVHPEDPRKNV